MFRYYKKRPHEPADEDIQLEAYLMWEEAGKPNERSDFFWNRAKRKLSSGSGAKEEVDPKEYSRVMDLIRSAGSEAWNSTTIRNMAASVGINMDRL